jgi:hypothetical protein
MSDIHIVHENPGQNGCKTKATSAFHILYGTINRDPGGGHLM